MSQNTDRLTTLVKTAPDRVEQIEGSISQVEDNIEALQKEQAAIEDGVCGNAETDMTNYLNTTKLAEIQGSYPPEFTWDSRQDVSNWTVTQGSWLPGSSEYVSDSTTGSIYLEELGTWVTNYRPSKIRITHNYVGGLEMILTDKNTDIIAQDVSLNSGEEIDITWGNYDMDNLFLNKFSQSYEIQNIEFYIKISDSVYIVYGGAYGTIDYTTGNITDWEYRQDNLVPTPSIPPALPGPPVPAYYVRYEYTPGDDTTIDDLVADYSFGNDYLTRPPITGATYGIIPRIGSLTNAANILNENADKVGDSVAVFNKYAT
jgi:hypothetical protein